MSSEFDFESVNNPSPTSLLMSDRGSPAFDQDLDSETTMPSDIDTTGDIGRITGTSNGPPVPRFGSIASKGIAWVGGPPTKNFTSTALKKMKTPLCMRDIDPSSDIKGYFKRVEGHGTKFKRDDPAFSLRTFANVAKEHFRHHGMDSVFYMVGTDDIGTDPGVELFTYHAKYTRDQVARRVNEKIADGTFDDRAKDCLSESATWLRASLGRISRSHGRISRSHGRTSRSHGRISQSQGKTS